MKGEKTAADSFMAFLQTPGIGGCEAKMLVGYTCNADVTLTTEEVAQAVSNVGNMMFPGVFEVRRCRLTSG